MAEQRSPRNDVSLNEILSYPKRAEFKSRFEFNRALNIRREAAEPEQDRLSQLGDGAQYDPRAAKVLAQIAGWSYSEGQTLLDELQHRGIVGKDATVQQFSVRNDAMLVVATAFFVQSGNVGVLSFRGTEPSNTINFLTDASVQARNFNSMGKVHGGFDRNVRAIWNDVATWIDTALQREDATRLKALYITGHSLGAAMAVVAAATIFGDNRPTFRRMQEVIRGIYTYGQPMVGDERFAESCDRLFGPRHFRHVYEHDLVPRMPPLTTGTFKHSGQEYAGNSEGWTPRKKAVAQALTAIVSIPLGAAAWVFKQFPLLRWIKLPFSIDDHLPSSYLEAFRAQSME